MLGVCWISYSQFYRNTQIFHGVEIFGLE